jgi:uncharacterized protein
VAEFLEKINDSTWRIKILVQPRARNNEVAGRHGDRIRIKIQAPPVDGKANRFLCSFLAEILGIRKNQLSVEKGLTAREKSVLVSDVDELFWKNFLHRYNNFN